MKEHIALHRNRPFAICSASDLNLEHHGTMLDELIALKMGFPIQQLQYVRLSLKTDSNDKCTRTTGVTRCTIQTIAHGRPDRSVSFVARVVRDLHQLTGAEALADSNLMKKLKPDFKMREELEEKGSNGTYIPTVYWRDVVPDDHANPVKEKKSVWRDANRDAGPSDPDISCDSRREAKRWRRMTGRDLLESSSDEASPPHPAIFESSSDRGSLAAPVSSCDSDSSWSTEDSRRASVRAGDEMTGRDLLDTSSSCGSARIRKVRGRNKKDKPADLARAQMGEEKWKEFAAAETKKMDKMFKNREALNYALLDKTFPGGAKAAHRSLAMVLERMKKEEEKEAFRKRKEREKLLKEDLKKKTKLLLIPLAHANIELGVVNWIGYDMNVINVARAKLILKLLTDKKCEDETILQIWFSTMIDKTADNALKGACAEMAITEDSKEMKLLFEFWSKEEISCKNASILWSQLVTSADLKPLMVLVHREDRMFFANYKFNGVLFVEQKMAVCNNSTMFSVPKELGDYQKSEDDFFNTLRLEEFQYTKNLYKSIKDQTLAGLKQLRGHLKDNLLKISLYVGEVSTNNKSLLLDVKKKDPVTIDWSNIPDYIPPHQFQSIVVLSSGSNTVHTAHFMNWIMLMFGTYIIDYIPRSQLPSDLRSLQSQPFSDQTGTINHLVGEFLQERKNMMTPILSSLKFLDSNTNLHNSCMIEVCLAMLAKKFRQRFIDFYFEANNKAKMEPFEIVTPFSRGSHDFCFFSVIHVN